MMESIIMPVIVGDDEKDLHFIYDDEIILLKLNGKEVCRFSFVDNFEDAIKRMLEIWSN